MPSPRRAAPRRFRRCAARLIAAPSLVALLLLAACSGGDPTPTSNVAATSETATLDEQGLVGRPQNRAGIGDVERAFLRYETTRAPMIQTFRDQPWFKDGLSRDEELFVERSLTFVARYSGQRRAYVDEETVRRKLYRYERVPLQAGELELLLIYEPGHDHERELTILRLALPALEALVGVPYPEKVMTVVNGAFEINDFSDGQFIRIARCCLTSPQVLIHELAHAYWSMGPSWFNEGMADIYTVFVAERLNREAPAGWRFVQADIDGYYRSRRSVVESGRLPDITLPRRLASDGLYEAADVFLLDVRRLLGGEAFANAARETYLASDYGRYNLREKRIQDIFLKHTKNDAREQVITLFNRSIWGDNGERYRELQELEGP